MNGVKFKATTDKSSHPTPEAPADQAMIYMLRPAKMGSKIQTKFGVDKEWKGANRGSNYSYFTVDPGERFLCSKAENSRTLALTVEAGKTYYVQQKIKMGLMKARNKLVQLSEAEGKEALAKCKLSVSELK